MFGTTTIGAGIPVVAGSYGGNFAAPVTTAVASPSYASYGGNYGAPVTTAVAAPSYASYGGNYATPVTTGVAAPGYSRNVGANMACTISGQSASGAYAAYAQQRDMQVGTYGRGIAAPVVMNSGIVGNIGGGFVETIQPTYGGGFVETIQPTYGGGFVETFGAPVSYGTVL